MARVGQPSFTMRFVPVPRGVCPPTSCPEASSRQPANTTVLPVPPPDTVGEKGTFHWSITLSSCSCDRLKNSPWCLLVWWAPATTPMTPPWPRVHRGLHDVPVPPEPATQEEEKSTAMTSPSTRVPRARLLADTSTPRSIRLTATSPLP